VAEVERAVELRFLAERVEALSLIDGQEDVVADVDPSPRISTRSDTLSSWTAAASLRGSASLPRTQ